MVLRDIVQDAKLTLYQIVERIWAISHDDPAMGFTRDIELHRKIMGEDKFYTKNAAEREILKLKAKIGSKPYRKIREYRIYHSLVVEEPRYLLGYNRTWRIGYFAEPLEIKVGQLSKKGRNILVDGIHKVVE